MRKVSEKQKRKNALLNGLKNTIIIYQVNYQGYTSCCICGCPTWNNDLIHLLPRSIYPQYYQKIENIGFAHRECHKKYDDDPEFRSKQEHLYKQVASFDKQAADKYFRRNG